MGKWFYAHENRYTSGMGEFHYTGLNGSERQHENYPILDIFSNLSSDIILILRPSIAMIFSEAKFVNVRMALEVVMLDRLAKSSRDR